MELFNFDSAIRACGLVFLSYIGFRLAKFLRRVIYVYFLAKRLGHVVDLKSFGKWAVVTGSTDGIGKAYAHELAKRGLSLFLISRNKEKLEATAAEIKGSNRDIEIRTLPFDFTNSELIAYDVIKSALSGLEIGILVNNVGMCNEYPEYFLSYPDGEKYWKKLIDVNCLAVTEMTHILLPQMLERKKGAVINISSGCGLLAIPLLSVYSASKCVHPHYVVTKMSKLKQSSFFAPNPDVYARSALNTVGLESETLGCLSHSIQHEFGQMVPNCFAYQIAKKMTVVTRNKYLHRTSKKIE